MVERMLLHSTEAEQELYREAVRHKLYAGLKRKSAALLIRSVGEPERHGRRNKVWVCWLQGMEQAPPVVQACFASVRRQVHDQEIVVLTAENFAEFVSLPEEITDKWRNGVMTHTHFSDLLRISVLAEQGGLWLDATVFCSGPLPRWILDVDLFVYRKLFPASNGRIAPMSNWLISANSVNPIIVLTRDLLYDYWSRSNYLADYFLFHIFFAMACEVYPDLWQRVPRFDSSAPLMLRYEMFDQLDRDRYETIAALSAFHKLTYKFPPASSEIAGTYYRALVDGAL
jgi:hypothetical protein